MTLRSETNEAKRLIREALSEMKRSSCRVSARTVDFTDLLRKRVLFVQVHDWKPDARWSVLREIARNNGFMVEAP